MSADIYTMFRRFIGDFTPDYDLPDLETMKFLDVGINKASELLDWRYKESLVISSADILAGFKATTYGFEEIVDFDLGLHNEDVIWQSDGSGKILFIDSSYITAGTYSITYKRTFKTFDNVLRENSYFDYPRKADLGIVFWALAEYQVTKGLINADNSANLVVSKSEEGMSVSYGTGSALELSKPEELKARAIEIFNMSSNRANITFSISV